MVVDCEANPSLAHSLTRSLTHTHSHTHTHSCLRCAEEVVELRLKLETMERALEGEGGSGAALNVSQLPAGILAENKQLKEEYENATTRYERLKDQVKRGDCCRSCVCMGGYLFVFALREHLPLAEVLRPSGCSLQTNALARFPPRFVVVSAQEPRAAPSAAIDGIQGPSRRCLCARSRGHNGCCACRGGLGWLSCFVADGRGTMRPSKAVGGCLVATGGVLSVRSHGAEMKSRRGRVEERRQVPTVCS